MKDAKLTPGYTAELLGRCSWAKRVSLLVVLAVAGFGYAGCVGTGAGAGYSNGYYAPSYSSYYGDYGYGGEPYWGAGSYVGNTVIIGGRSHRGYYGGHHFSRDSRGPSGGFNRGGSSRGGSASRAGMPGGGARGGRN
jgi:hypothetical protein